MNTDYIASNLKNAEEELTGLIAHIRSGEELSFEDFHLAIAHIYHHLNSAWNGRYITDAEWRECTEENWQKWRSFPQNLPLVGNDDYFDLPEYNAKT